ncbi:TPR-like protein [Melanomma pulvis-pyrius CBS 109.77]|uniref:TPR-like protein n=1 Tax=Melanomma pulvis-pyrius CBS 109.77 TaxID=1314802 RepID=A0A6A6XWK8_9PLEO|nr:TPR-like protein [Melanomma pulvis-pyrius CBS 109.77]
MLERAPTCLETGRHLLRTPKRCTHGRRTLHSSFWHHGASDLNLPIWWASTSIFGLANSDDSGGRRTLCRGSKRSDGLLLDFLYPEKTVALLQRISTYGLASVEARRRHQINGNGFRQFSTTRWEAKGVNSEADAHSPLLPKDGGADTGGGDAISSTRQKTRTINRGEHHDKKEAKAIELRDTESREFQFREEMEERLQGNTASDALYTLLKAKELGKQELAWRLYSAIQESSRTPDIKATLLEYLTSHTVSVESSRILQIFDTLPLEYRRASSYRTAISAYVALRMVGPAIQLHEESAARFSGLDCGTDAILGRTIEDNHWDLTLHVFRTFLRSALPMHIQKTPFTDHREDIKAVWKTVARLPSLSDHLLSLLEYVERFQDELKSTEGNEKALRIFINGFVPLVIEQVLTPIDPDEDYILELLLGLFSDLRTLGLPRISSYDYAIGRLLKLPRYREYTNQRKIFQELYNKYKEESMQDPTHRIRPSKSIITNLIMQHGAFGSIEVVGDLVQDLRTFYKDQWCTHAHTMVYLVRFYAEYGKVDEVHEYFDVLSTHFPNFTNLKTIASLLYVYARRVDVQGTMDQFKRISKEFGLVPDTACWNILLLAHTRADDLDGALECFNRILESGVVPDTHTFGPLLDLCASRGDVEAFEALYSKAEQLKVPVRTDVRARAGYVQAFLQSGDPEGAEAVAQGMLKSHQAETLRGSLTHTWNLLITHYALQGDVGNSRRLYRYMVDNNIPLDSWTYAALMRSLIEVRQTNAAYKILRVTMPNNNMRVHGFHYALVITGFLREGQYEHALRAHNRMEARNVKQTKNSRQASLLAIGITELRKLQELKITDPRTRLIAVEETLRGILFESYESELANREPKHSRFIESQEHSVPQGYFGLLILLYSTRGAYEICKELFEAASMARPNEADYEPPITLLTTIMEAHFKAKEYDEVAKCWELARVQAEKLVKTLQQVIDPQPAKVEFDSLLDPALKESGASAKIATNRRHVLYRAARIYIRSLLIQDDPKYVQEAQRTISQLLNNGYVIDNLTWNEFIQMLARRGRIVDAFSACEYYLMPQFPGWRTLQPYYIRRNVSGFFWMELRNSGVGHKSIMPRYKTLVILAAAYTQIKRDEANGMGYNPEIGGWAREVLEQISPLTVRAIETMPRTGDRLQMRYIEGM